MPREDAKLALKELDTLEKEELKKKHELEKLKQKIKDASKHVKEEQELEEKVPIEQVMANSDEGLSTEEKVILNMVKGELDQEHKDSKVEKKNLESSKPKSNLKNSRDSESSLEETLDFTLPDSRFVSKPGESRLAQYNYAHIVDMSKQPMEKLYSEMKDIYDTGVAEGYVSGSAVQQALELESAIERKLRDVEMGNYSFNSERVAKAASVSLELKDRVSSMYVSKKNFVPGSDWYR